VTLVFRVNTYPLFSTEANDQLSEEISAIVDTNRCALSCTTGEVKLRQLTQAVSFHSLRASQGVTRP